MSKSSKNYKKFRKAAKKLYGNGDGIFPWWTPEDFLNQYFGPYFQHEFGNNTEGLINEAININNGDYYPDADRDFMKPIQPVNPQAPVGTKYPYDLGWNQNEPVSQLIKGNGFVNNQSMKRKIFDMQYKADLGTISNVDPTSMKVISPDVITSQIVCRSGNDLFCRIPDDICLEGHGSYYNNDMNISGYSDNNHDVEKIIAFGLIHATGYPMPTIIDKRKLFMASLGCIYQHRDEFDVDFLVDMGIIFVFASEFRIWTSCVYNLYPHICVRDIFAGGAYYFPNDEDCYHFMTATADGTHTYKKYKPCMKGLSSESIATYDDEISISSDDVIMIVNVPSKESFDNIIDVATTFMRNRTDATGSKEENQTQDTSNSGV